MRGQLILNYNYALTEIFRKKTCWLLDSTTQTSDPCHLVTTDPFGGHRLLLSSSVGPELAAIALRDLCHLIWGHPLPPKSMCIQLSSIPKLLG